MLHTKINNFVFSKSFNIVSFVAVLAALLMLAIPLRVVAQTSELTVTPSTLPTTPVTVPDTADKTYPYQETFRISAYYSPIANQQKYVTGSYDGDVKLNGDGVKAADGTLVYPGMVAAPKGYAFGTKLLIPGIGTVAVHDRGGAIVHSGQRGNSYDRLDVWMGYGDAGLTRALKWGKRTIEATVYGVDNSIVEKVELAGYSEAEKNSSPGILKFDSPSTAAPSTSTDAQTVNLASTIVFGSSSPDVAKVQTTLKKLNYYHGEITSVYDQATRDAVTRLQVAEQIVAHENDFGAGYLGPKTMKILASKLDVPTANAASVEVDVQQAFANDLKLGDSGDDVRRLQEELKRVNLLGIDSTGFYGDVTAHAVLKFQQITKLAGDASSNGAGILGPLTRSRLNALVAERERTEQLIAARKEKDNI